MRGTRTVVPGDPRRATRRAWLGVAALAALLAGCGRKGALYLPEEEGRPARRDGATPEPTTTAPDDLDTL
jgi:predicted small lipoprotein YifL